jgi:hypothetical protein
MVRGEGGESTNQALPQLLFYRQRFWSDRGKLNKN